MPPISIFGLLSKWERSNALRAPFKKRWNLGFNILLHFCFPFEIFMPAPVGGDVPCEFAPKNQRYWGDRATFARACASCSEVSKSGGEVVFTLKAFNGRVVTEWLSHCLGDIASRPHDDDRIPLTYVAMILGSNTLGLSLSQGSTR